MRSTRQISRSDEAEVAGYAAEGAIRAVEVAPLVLIGLLVCPPLAILVVVFVVPLLLAALVVGLLAAVVTTPYVIFEHVRGHRYRFPVEISARQDFSLAGEHERIVGHRVGLALEHAGGEAKMV